MKAPEVEAAENLAAERSLRHTCERAAFRVQSTLAAAIVWIAAQQVCPLFAARDTCPADVCGSEDCIRALREHFDERSAS